MRRSLNALMLAAAVLASACGDDDAHTGGDGGAVSGVAAYVGALENGDARLAIVRDASAFTAYVCGTGPTLLTHTRWFQSEAGGGASRAVKDGWELRLAASERGMLRGELQTPEGDVLAWSASPAQAGTEEGLYQANHAGCRAGIIVWQAEAGPGCKAQGSWCDAQGQRGQITPVVCAPDEPLQVAASDGSDAFQLTGERVEAP